MVTKHSVNEDRVYYNFDGQMPPVTLEDEAAPLPVTDVEPKLLTDTTLRDGAPDARFAFFPNEARLKYVALLHLLDNGSGQFEGLPVSHQFRFSQRDTGRGGAAGKYVRSCIIVVEFFNGPQGLFRAERVP